jgi:[1-hydroxy-2-(trimethylamino)ethyl]phosphonate dioxygenase
VQKLQSAYFAEQAGASPMLIAAALLHDCGHLIHDLPEDIADQGIDAIHEQVERSYIKKGGLVKR